MLMFQVQGSASLPYKIRAEGEGASLRIFCSCPAGKKALTFCKHVQALILNKVEKLVHPSDSIEELARVAIGSQYLAKAETHVAADIKNKVAGCSSLDDIVMQYGQRLEGMGWSVQKVVEAGDFPSEELGLYARTKGGLVRKHPKVTLRWELLSYDTVLTVDGSFGRVDIKPRVKPWTVRGKEVTKSFSNLDGALYQFLINAGYIVS